MQLPARFNDFVPQALADEADPISSPPTSPSPSSPSTSPAAPSPLAPTSGSPHIDTAQNIYGLYRRFTGHRLPNHDPESSIDLPALTDAAMAPSGQPLAPPDLRGGSLYPFDNQNAFLIGEWMYSEDASISIKRFHQLTEIIGNPNFKPEDIRKTNWPEIHNILGRNIFDSAESVPQEQEEWEDADAGWRKSPITIGVPFHGHSDAPGVHDFPVGDLYYRRLIDIIREKLANPIDDAQFHYEPYELCWQPRADGAKNTRVHGEFYTSPAFRSAHDELQAAPNEPGCSLPKVVLAMQFASDSTQLAHFGTAKLWPLYLYFLNESKYRRCKPTSNLCNHVAYFQSVGNMPFEVVRNTNIPIYSYLDARFLPRFRHRTQQWAWYEQAAHDPLSQGTLPRTMGNSP